MARASTNLGQSDFKEEIMMHHWWAMHGYAKYIWSAYSLVVGVMGLNAYYAWSRSKQVLQHLHKWVDGQ